MATAFMKPAQAAATEKPSTLGGRIVQMTPIVLTILATALAGMSSSEMTQSMYYRSLAGQQQSKAGDQWAFFQAKRIRGTSLEGTVTLLHGLGNAQPLNAERLKQMVSVLAGSLAAVSPDAKQSATKSQDKFDQWLAAAEKNESLKYLVGPELPHVDDQQLPETSAYLNLRAAVKSMERRHTDMEMAALVKDIPPVQVDEATQMAEQNADAFDAACEPATKALGQLRALVAELNIAAAKYKTTSVDAPDGYEVGEDLSTTGKARQKLESQMRDLTTTVEAAAAEFDARRYRRESAYNRKAGELYELRVARSGVSSDTHRERSKKFFLSMLLAQAGVTISSLALARANRSLFWTFAAVAGLSSLVFTAMTYFSAA